MEQSDTLDAFFVRAKKHRIPMAAICKRALVDPTTPSRWRRGKNGATLERVNRLNEALTAIIAEDAGVVVQKRAA